MLTSETSFSCPPELTIVTADDVKERLLGFIAGAIDIDVSGVQIVDTAGLQLLVSAALAWRRRGHRFAISGTSRALSDAARVSGLSDVLPLSDPPGPQ